METVNNDDGRELAKLAIGRMQDILLARMIVREEAGRLGFSAQAITQIATVTSEITRNVVQHAGSAGQVRIFEITNNGRLGLRISVEDAGAGIADVDRVLAGASPGAGIPGCRKLVDEFTLKSTNGGGTAVTMIKWLPNA